MILWQWHVWQLAPDAKLFTIKLDIVKTTSMDIEYIILITDFLSSVRKVVYSFVYFRQAYLFAVYSVLRSFSYSFNYKIKFWNCLSNAK